MTTLKQLAAEKNLFAYPDIPKKWRGYNFDFKTKDVNELKNITILKEIQKLDNYEIDLFFECRTQDEGTAKELNYIEHSHIIVKRKDSDVLMILKESYKSERYFFHLAYHLLHKYHKISHYKRDEALKTISEPQKIGVFSVKKLDAWINYCIDYKNTLDALLNDVTEKNKQVDEEIKNFIDSLPQKTVRDHKDRVYIDTDLFSVIFEIDRPSAYLRTDIRYKGGLENVVKIQNTLK
jgi:hypothetical protein